MLTTQRKLFIEEYLRLKCKNATQAAIKAGYSEKTAQSQASQILKDANVANYLEVRRQGIARELQQEYMFDALEAKKVMYQIMKNPAAEDKDRINVAKDFLDRAGFKYREQVEINGGIEVKLQEAVKEWAK